MARPKGALTTKSKKNLSLDDQLSEITVKITNAEKTLKEMKQMKKNLEEQIRLSRLNELDELITSKGMDIDAVKALLEK